MWRMIGYNAIDFLKNSSGLNIFNAREDSTVQKNKKKCLQEFSFGKKLIAEVH